MIPRQFLLREWDPSSMHGHDIAERGRRIETTLDTLAVAVRELSSSKSWSGPAHDTAAEAFAHIRTAGRTIAAHAERFERSLHRAADDVARARTDALTHVAELTRSPLWVSDIWVVLIDPVPLTAEQIGELRIAQQRAQSEINELIVAVGQADRAQALAHSTPDLGVRQAALMQLGTGSAAPDPALSVPDPYTPAGMLQMDAARRAYEATTPRASEKTTGTERDTLDVTYQDGSRAEIVNHKIAADGTVYTEGEHERTVVRTFSADGVLTSTSDVRVTGRRKDTKVDYPNKMTVTLVEHGEYRDATITYPDGTVHEIGNDKSFWSEMGDAATTWNNPVAFGLDFAGGLPSAEAQRAAALAAPRPAPPVVGAASNWDPQWAKRGSIALSVGIGAYEWVTADTSAQRCKVGLSTMGSIAGGVLLTSPGASGGALVGGAVAGPTGAAVGSAVGGAVGGMIGSVGGGALGGRLGDKVCS